MHRDERESVGVVPAFFYRQKRLVGQLGSSLLPLNSAHAQHARTPRFGNAACNLQCASERACII